MEEEALRWTHLLYKILWERSYTRLRRRVKDPLLNLFLTIWTTIVTSRRSMKMKNYLQITRAARDRLNSLHVMSIVKGRNEEILRPRNYTNHRKRVPMETLLTTRREKKFTPNTLIKVTRSRRRLLSRPKAEKYLSRSLLVQNSKRRKRKTERKK